MDCRVKAPREGAFLPLFGRSIAGRLSEGKGLFPPVAKTSIQNNLRIPCTKLQRSANEHQSIFFVR
jgi:hypothetical protein